MGHYNTFIHISLSVVMIFKHSKYNAIKTVAITMVRLPAIQLAMWEFSSADVFEELLSIVQGDFFKFLRPTWLERAYEHFVHVILISRETGTKDELKGGTGG